VEDIHDLHVWAISTTQIALSVHLVIPGGCDDKFLSEFQEELYHNFGIGHTTIQIENKSLEGNVMTGC
ncbi:MAG: cation transporter, partial [Bacteroidota bacterium]